MPRKHTTRVEILCQRCGKPFTVPANRSSKARFCSQECHYGQPVSRLCENCGVSFAVIAARAETAKYCSTQCHYEGRSGNLIDSFSRNVEKTDYCWTWTGSIASTGYGQLTHRAIHYATHRLAFEFSFGKIPEGFSVLHTCDKRSCVRNDDAGWYEINGVLRPRFGHLWIGTQADNMADMANKGRSLKGYQRRADHSWVL